MEVAADLIWNVCSIIRAAARDTREASVHRLEEAELIGSRLPDPPSFVPAVVGPPASSEVEVSCIGVTDYLVPMSSSGSPLAPHTEAETLDRGNGVSFRGGVQRLAKLLIGLVRGRPVDQLRPALADGVTRMAKRGRARARRPGTALASRGRRCGRGSGRRQRRSAC